MARIRQSICFPPIKPAAMSYDELFGAGADIGYEAVELWGRGDDFDGVCAAAARHGLGIASMVGHGSIAEGLNDPSNHDRIEAEVAQSIDVAAERGIRGVIAFSGNRREGVSDAEAIEITAEGLGRIAAYAEEKSVYVNLELLNSMVDHGGYQCDRSAWGVGAVEKVASPFIRLLYDIYHMQIMEGDIIRTIREHVRWIGHFHAAGNPGRHEPDDEQELDYRGICRAIAATDYEGYFGQEFVPKRDPVEALRIAFAACDVD